MISGYTLKPVWQRLLLYILFISLYLDLGGALGVRFVALVIIFGSLLFHPTVLLNALKSPFIFVIFLIWPFIAATIGFAGGAILFFDEADALFGKRSEVKDSHDRYANIEINYLLQRMEAYRGLAILATNMKSALDPAFMRRLRFIVNFPFPGPAERIQMWQKAFPAAMPKDELDWTRLARLNLTGGNIHTVALNAAFAAAHSEDKRVTMELVLAAARAEFRKLDRVVNEADFKWVTPKKPEAKAVEVAEVTA